MQNTDVYIEAMMDSNFTFSADVIWDSTHTKCQGIYLKKECSCVDHF